VIGELLERGEAAHNSDDDEGEVEEEEIYEEEEEEDDDEGEAEEEEIYEEEEEEEDDEEEEEEGDEGDWEDVEDDVDDGSQNASEHNQDSMITLDRRRVLTSEDFELLERLKEAYVKRLKDPRVRSGLKVVNPSSLGNADPDADEEGNNSAAASFTVLPESLAPQAKTGKSTKIARLTRILEGRKENAFQHEGHAGGLTNKEKLRKKNYVMVRKGKRDVADKIRVSNSTARWQAAHRVLIDFCICALS
jgi:hypothetical protein